MEDDPRFASSSLDYVEDAEDYQPGGFHPIFIGDIFAQERYRVIHKLGFGGFSTVWLARDQLKHSGGLVTLKALRADASTKAADEMPELIVPRMLQAVLPTSNGFQIVIDHFVVQGENGTHRFIVSPFAGPSVLDVGSRRLRGDLARRVAKQTATMVNQMHRAGFVHGDLTTSNILFRIADHVIEWSDAQVYTHLGEPETDKIKRYDGQPVGPHAPAKLVAPIANTRLADPSILREDIILIDFGQSYAITSPPPDYEPSTVVHYQPPESRFEERVGPEADVWGLACAIFEIRAGRPLFKSFFGTDLEVLVYTVAMLGRLPDPWWETAFGDRRARWFEDDGECKSAEAQELGGAGNLTAAKTSIRAQLRSIGARDDPPKGDEGPMIEKSGVRLEEEEVALLGDLLEKMLRYRPEERITMQDVVTHPWFSL